MSRVPKGKMWLLRKTLLAVGVTQADDESNKDVSKLLSLDAYI